MAEVHDLVYHGNGGFPYDQVYNMPIQYRKYHIKKINEFLEKKNEAEEKAMKQHTSSAKSPSKPSMPPVDFSTKFKAPKK